MNTQDLINKRAGIVEQMRQIATDMKVPGLTEARVKELDEQFERAEKDERNLSKEIQREQRLEDLERTTLADTMEARERQTPKEDKGKKLDYAQAFRSWFTSENPNQLAPEVRAMLETRGTSTQAVGTTTLGGYTVDSSIWPEIVRIMKDYSGIADACTTIFTATGGPLYFTVNSDITAKAVLVSESGSRTVQDTSFTRKTLDAYAYSDLMKVSWELMQDSEFDMAAEINENLTVRFGRALNYDCTLADGSSKPQGIVPVSALGVTAASTTAVTRGELLDLIGSVNSAYRKSPKCGFMFNDTTLTTLKKLSFGTGDDRPLWVPSMRDDAPDRLEGYRYWINTDMADAAAATKPILFGDFSKYKVRIVKGMQIKRLDELYAGTGEVGFMGYMRFDGELIDAATATAVKHLIQHA